MLFLQRLYRASIALWPRAWSRGGRVGTGRVFARPVHRCRGGRALANESEFSEQSARAERMLLWYDQYVTILRRLRSGEAPKLLHLFGGGGGSSEGSRRAGALGICVDNEPQPDYERRFGKESFKLGDATSWATVAKLEAKHHFTACLASPPCKAYSRALSGGKSLVPKLIPVTRDLLRTFFRHWAIENVMGAAKEMSPSSAELYGQAFGLRVDRARKIESSFCIRIDEAVALPGRELRKRTCLGRRRRWKRVDVFGRPVPDCCSGNIFAIQGRTPWRCTTEECAAAMDVDASHMTYDRLAQSIPPAYTRLVTGQACMSEAHASFGVPMVSYDEHVADPDGTSRLLAGWLRGAGDDQSSAGLGFVRGRVAHDDGICEESDEDDIPDLAGDVESSPADCEVPDMEEDAFRELYYSHVGGFDQRWIGASMSQWLGRLRNYVALGGEVSPDELIGHNTFVSVSWSQTGKVADIVLDAVAKGGRGTRATIEVDPRHAAGLGRRGFRREHDGSSPRGTVFMSIGSRGEQAGGHRLDHARCNPHMDSRDIGKKTWADDSKRERAWEPVPWDAERWRGRGLPEAVAKVMTEGTVVELHRALHAREIPQYPFASQEAQMEASIEADRAIATGHMSYVPPDEVEEALRIGAVHPWTMTEQGSKWRACQDYSGITNRAAVSAPFGLPTPWDVKKVIRPDDFDCPMTGFS